jgi:hypothetical protein
MSTTAEVRNHLRFTQALWYAWGQQDAGFGTTVEAFEFAERHARDAIAYEAVRDCRTSTGPSFLSSIQSAWIEFVGAAVTS